MCDIMPTRTYIVLTHTIYMAYICTHLTVGVRRRGRTCWGRTGTTPGPADSRRACGHPRRANRVRTGAAMSQNRCRVFARRAEVAFPFCRAWVEGRGRRGRRGWGSSLFSAGTCTCRSSSLFSAGTCTCRRRACKSRRRSSPVRPVRGSAPSAMGGVRPERLNSPI